MHKSVILFSLIRSIYGMFPMGRCYVNSCASSSYNLTALNTSCFFLTPKICTDTSKYDCCTGFQSNLEKIIMSLNPACKSSFAYVTINNIIKIGGVYIDTFDDNSRSQIRVTSLGLNPSMAISINMCIKFNNKNCTDFNTFCQDTDGICKYATFSSSVNNCCPTCNLNSPTPNPVYIPSPSPKPPSPKPSNPSQSPTCQTACCAKCIANSSLNGTCFSLPL